MGRPKKIVEEDNDVNLGFDEDRERVMNRLDIMDDEDLRLIYRCSRKTLQNRQRAELPPFFRAGGQRLYFREDVIRFFRSRTKD